VDPVDEGGVDVGPAGSIWIVANMVLTTGTTSWRRWYAPITTYRQNARPDSLKNRCNPAWPGS
jgi:hypothetical protein